MAVWLVLLRYHQVRTRRQSWASGFGNLRRLKDISHISHPRRGSVTCVNPPLPPALSTTLFPGSPSGPAGM